MSISQQRMGNSVTFFLQFLHVVSSFQSKSSLEMMESQSCDAEPPPPPKPELRYPGITRGNTEGDLLLLCLLHFSLSASCSTYSCIQRFENPSSNNLMFIVIGRLVISTVASHHEGPGFKSLRLRGYAVMCEITLISDFGCGDE